LKRQSTEREKGFASFSSDRVLITRIYRQLKKPNSPKNDPMKWANELNRHFSKEKFQMDRKHMKKCSTSLCIKEMQIKTTLRFQLTPVSMAITRNTNRNKKCWQGCLEKGTLRDC
jgi:hypothetical protein